MVKVDSLQPVSIITQGPAEIATFSAPTTLPAVHIVNNAIQYHNAYRPGWATSDGFVPSYPIPANRPDPLAINKIDCAAIPGIASMQRYGMAVSITYLRELGSYVDFKISEILKSIAEMIPQSVIDELIDDAAETEQYDEKGTPLDGVKTANVYEALNIDSPLQLAQLLFDKLGIGSGKVLKTTKSGAVSVDKEQLQKLAADSPIVAKILEYRMYVKAKNTYIDKFPQIAVKHPACPKSHCHICGRRHYEDVWRIHTTVLSTRASTGRLASKNPNLQNIPARTELGRMIRAAFIAELGYMLVDADLSQAELRLLGHRAQEPKIIAAFKAGMDIHTATAMHAFKIDDPAKVDPDMHRAPCKNVNFSVVYGITPEGLYDLMVMTYATANRPVPAWLTLQWCVEFIDLWFATYSRVKPYLELEHHRPMSTGVVWTEYGRIRRIPEVQSVHKHIRSAGNRQAGNAGIQGTCADIMRIIIAVLDTYYNVYQRKLYDKSQLSFLLMSIHDQALTEAPEDRAEQVLKDQMLLMQGVTECWMSVNMKVDGKMNEYWKK